MLRINLRLDITRKFPSVTCPILRRFDRTKRQYFVGQCRMTGSNLQPCVSSLEENLENRFYPHVIYYTRSFGISNIMAWSWIWKRNMHEFLKTGSTSVLTIRVFPNCSKRHAYITHYQAADLYEYLYCKSNTYLPRVF